MRTMQSLGLYKPKQCLSICRQQEKFGTLQTTYIVWNYIDIHRDFIDTSVKISLKLNNIQTTYGVKQVPLTLLQDPEPFESLNGQNFIITSILYISFQVSVQISSKLDNIQTSYGVKHASHTLLLDPEPFLSLNGQN